MADSDLLDQPPGSTLTPKKPLLDLVKAEFEGKILGIESGHRQFTGAGTTVVSPAGAVGIAQVMPATGPEAASLAGLPWDPYRFEVDGEYNKALGFAYFKKQYETYGSLDKAAAAYNAGPGNLESAMNKARLYGGDYTQYLPTETQRYVKMATGIGGDNFIGEAQQITEPPPPPGFTIVEEAAPAKAEAREPPPPPGFKIVEDKRPGYDKMAAQPIKPLSAIDLYHQMLKNTTGALAPIVEEAKEIPGELTTGELGPTTKQDVEQVKGMASGAAQAVTGLGELTPRFPFSAAPIDTQQRSAEATKYLQGVGDPDAQQLGTIVAQSVPGAKAMEALAPVGKGAIRTLAGATAVGASVGAAAPTGETDPSKRELKETANAATGAVGGAALGALHPLAKAPAFIQDSTGVAADRAAEALRKTTAPKVAGALEYETGKAAETLAQGDVSGSQAMRLRAAKQNALDAGLNEMEAETFARGEATRVADAEKTAGAIVADQAKRPTMTKEDFGAKVQESANAIYEKLDKERYDKSGFGEAIAAAGDKPIVNTSVVDAYLKKVEPNIANEGTKSIFNWIRRQLTTEQIGEKSALFPLEAAPKKTLDAIPVAKADSLRKAIDGALRTKKMIVDNNVAADASEALHHLGQIRHLLVDSAKDAAPQYGGALQKYKALSRPLDPFESKKGALKGVIAADSLSRDFTMTKANVVGATLSRNPQAFGKLVQQDPSLKDAARMYFNEQLLGPGGAAKNVTAAQMNAFLRTNGEALRQSGLYDEFSTLKGAREAGEKAIESAQADVRRGEEAAKRLEAAHDWNKVGVEIEHATPEQVPTLARSTLKKLLDEGHITQGQYGHDIDTINDASKKFEDKTRARYYMRRIVMGTLAAAGLYEGGRVLEERMH